MLHNINASTKMAKATLALALGLTGIAVPVTLAAGSASAELDTSPAASAGAAMTNAQASGERVEDLSQRTEMTQVFANPNGTWTQESYAEPIRATDANGDWHELDLTLVSRDGAITPRFGPADVAFSNGGDTTFADATVQGHDVSFTWDEPLPVPTLDGPTATYADVAPGQDLVVTATTNGFEHSLVLNEEPDGPVEFSTGVVVDGGSVSEVNSGGPVVKNDDGEIVATIPQPVVYDAGQEPSDEGVEPVDAEVSAAPGDGQELSVTATEDYLLRGSYPRHRQGYDKEAFVRHDREAECPRQAHLAASCSKVQHCLRPGSPCPRLR